MSVEHKSPDSQAPEHHVEEEPMPRRRFLSFMAGTLATITGAGIVAPLVGMFLAPLFERRKELWLALGRADDLSKEQPKRYVFRYVRMDGWFEKTVYGTAYAVRNGAGVVVLSNICTHLGCGVRWDQGKQGFFCPCHNGVFDRNGKVIAGPPPKPLKRYDSRIVNGQIQIRIEEV